MPRCGTPMLAWFVLLVCLVCPSRPYDATTTLQFSRHGLFWGGGTRSNASISEENVWRPIDGTNVTFPLGKSSQVLVTYHILLEGVRGYGLGVLPTPRESNKDTLQVRALIDGVPFRVSSTYASAYLVEQRTLTELTGTFMANISTGSRSHTVALQWKKSGNQVSRWLVSPQTLGSGYSISVLADHDHSWYLHEGSDAVITAQGAWQPLSGKLSFELERDRIVTLGYSFSVQPQLASFIKDRRQEFISSRLVVDGVPFAEGAETHSTGTWNPVAGVLNGYISLKLPAGPHEVQLQWRRMGDAFKAWSSSPSYLDGFASSRNLFVVADKVTAPAFYGHDRVVLAGDSQWRVVGNHVHTLTLVKQSAILITYGLPVTQRSNPKLPSALHDALATVRARIMVDNLPYEYSSSSTSASQDVLTSLFVSLPIVLEAGTHSIALQWKADGADWTGLNGLADGFAHSERLLVFITSENAVPRISTPRLLSTDEDVALSVTSLVISDVDSSLAGGMIVQFNLTVFYGTLMFQIPPTANDVAIVPDNPNSTVVTYVFSDSIESINSILLTTLYKTPRFWNGNDTLVVSLNDEGNIGFGAAKTITTSIPITVASVDNPFTLQAPEIAYFMEDEEKPLPPFHLLDVDSQRSIFRVRASCFAGYLTLNTSEPLTYFVGDGLRNAALDFQAPYAVIQRVLLGMNFTSRQDANTLRVDEFLSLELINTDNAAHTVSIFVPLVIIAVNDAPEIVFPQATPRLRLHGIKLLSTRDETSTRVTYSQVEFDKAETAVVDGTGGFELWNHDKFGGNSEASVITTASDRYIVGLKSSPTFVIHLVSSSYVMANSFSSIVVKSTGGSFDANNSFNC